MAPAHILSVSRMPSGSRWRSMLLYLALENSAPTHSELTPSDADGTTSEKIQQFESFFHDFEQPIFGYLWRMTGDEQAASDLLQETFVRAWQHFAKISRYDRPGAWLFRVATNLALNYRRDQTMPLANTVPVEETDSVSQRDIGSLVAMRDLVREALLALSPQQRSALVLREIYGLPLKEISHVLHLAPNTVKVTLWRAREQFRVHYLQANNATTPPTAPAMAMDDLLVGDDSPELFFASEGEQI